jgi:exosortase
VAAFLPLLALQLRALWLRSHYQFFPFLLLGIAWFVWRRWPEQPPHGTAWTRGLERGTLWLSLLLLVIAIAVFSPWLAAVASFLMAGSLMLHHSGTQFWRQFMPVWLLLWLMQPPPLGFDRLLIERLQAFTSQAASTTLDCFGVTHLLEGNVIELLDRQLFVEEACSGIESLIAMLTCVTAFMVYRRRPLIHAMLLIVSSVFWAGLANTCRVLLVVFSVEKYGVDFSTGWPHEVLGLITFAFALFLVASTDRLLFVLFTLLRWFGRWTQREWRRRFGWRETTAADVAREDPEPVERPAATRPWATPVLAVLALAMLVIQVAILVPSRPNSAIRLGHVVEQLDEEALPETFRGWKRVDYDQEQREKGSDEGEFSRIWTYTGGPCEVRVSFDYPFLGWHELSNCYRSSGWAIHSRAVLGLTDSQDPEGIPCVEVQMSKPTGRSAYLVFCLFDESGQALQPARSSMSVRQRLRDRIENGPLFRLLHGVSSPLATPSVTTYQAQILAPADVQLTAEQQDEIRSWFLALTDQLRGTWRHADE